MFHGNLKECQVILERAYYFNVSSAVEIPDSFFL